MQPPPWPTPADPAGDIATWRFAPDALNLAARAPGISAFMRIRDGEAFLERAIRSHVDHVDEIVALHNRCADRTPDILARLAQEFGPKLRVYRYLPDVFPPGSEGHRREPADSSRSLVNYYNLSLCLTRFSHAMKLDDDHVAMRADFAAIARDARRGAHGAEMSCFSGVNLARGPDGALGVFATDPLAGAGDHGIFPVRPDTFFVHDTRFERFQRGSLKRRFRGFAYWHLKYLKDDLGYSNYDLAANPDSRYARRLEALKAAHRVVPVAELPTLMRWKDRALAALGAAHVPLPEKLALKAARWRAAPQAVAAFPALIAEGEPVQLR